MNPDEMLKAAYETTHIIRERKYSLYTFGTTKLPYYFIGRSEIDPKDTVVREGRVVVEKPQILLPGTLSMFEGFEFDEDMGIDADDARHLLLSRRILLPSLKYVNHENNMEVVAEGTDERISRLQNELERRSDTVTGIIRGEDRFFPFPLFFYVGKMVIRSTGDNIAEFFEKRGGFGH